MAIQGKLLIMKIMSEIYEEHFVKIKTKLGIILVEEREKVWNSRISQCSHSLSVKLMKSDLVVWKCHIMGHCADTFFQLLFHYYIMGINRNVDPLTVMCVFIFTVRFLP